MANIESTIFIVDDDETTRDSLRRHLSGAGLAFEAYSTTEQFLARCSADRPGCLLLGATRPGDMGGLQLLGHLRLQGWLLPVIFLVGRGDVPLVLKAWRSGAFDCLEKPIVRRELLACANEALAADGELRAGEALRASAKTLLARLTRREELVLKRLLEGQSNKLIAFDLGISERTVEKHRQHLMHKLGVRSLAALMRMVTPRAPLESTGTYWVPQRTVALASHATLA